VRWVLSHVVAGPFGGQLPFLGKYGRDAR